MFNPFEDNLPGGDGEFSTGTSPFFTDQMFVSREVLLEWTQNIARSMGYVIVTRRSKTYVDGTVSKVILICDRGREYKVRDTSRASGSKKTNCQFQLEGKYSKKDDRWMLRVVCDEHNHDPVFKMEGHAFVRRLSADEKRLVADLTRKNVSPSDILSTLKEQNENPRVIITDDCMHPRVIITDRELALVNACATIFPHAKRLLCRWHIEQNIMRRHKNSFKTQHDWNAFKGLWMILVDSPTWIAYMENYRRLQSMLTNYQRVFDYIEDNWLNNYKEMFVSVWIDQHLNFGNRTTNRAESQHAKLKKHLDSSSSNLDKFVRLINQIVQSQVTSINESFEKSRIHRYNHHNLPCFRLLRGYVSNEALDMMLGELQRPNALKLDSSNCGCQLRNSCGLPCACMISAYSKSGESIPLDSIDIFWRKLDFSKTTQVQEDDDIRCDDVLEQFKEHFNAQSKVVKKSHMRKLLDIFKPHTTNIEEPVVQKNTRGRPSMKKQQKKHVNPQNQAPRRCSYSARSEFTGFDLNKEPERHSYSYEIDLNDETQSHDPLQSHDPFQSQDPFQSHDPWPSCDPELMQTVPYLFHDYVDGIQNVNGDGNCGFRSVAVCLGYDEDQWLYIRQQLREEIESEYSSYRNAFTYGFNELYESLCWSTSPAPFKRHWMIMPLTGYLIANKFGVIVHSLSHKQSVTCFPLWRGPEEFQAHRSITLVNVNDLHYMSVFLKGNYPMPPTCPYWNYHRTPSASAWKTTYWSRFELYDELAPRSFAIPQWIHVKE